MKRNIVNINLLPKDPQQKQPGIYIHYYKDQVQYVGQTINVFDGRPFRASYGQPVDKIRWLRAPQNDRARHKWEAYLVVKLKPTRQNIEFYRGKAGDWGFYQDEKQRIEEQKSEKRKATRQICKILRSALYDYSISKKGHIHLSQRDIELRRRDAYYGAIKATTKIMNAEDKMIQWHNDVLFNYAMNKRREIEEELFGPITI